MNIGLFGGTFDPIHRGHLAVAHAARERCKLERVLFVPTDIPPHKSKQPITEYAHRYAMIALAVAEEKNFVPSLLEAPHGADRMHYSVDTVRHLRRELKQSDRIFFLIGLDAFLDIAKWREPETLLRACEFVVVSRPGYFLSDVADALPPKLRPRTILSRNEDTQSTRTLTLPGVTIHLLEGVDVPVSATEIRTAAARVKSRALEKMVPSAVAAYIKKMHLYQHEVE